MLNNFLNVILDVKGNISPNRLNKKYFEKIDKLDLWNWFEFNKINFPNYANREIILLLQNGYTNPPKCIVCGNNSKIQVYKGKSNISFDYCSKKCSYISTKRNNKISKTKNSKSKLENDIINEKRENTMETFYGVKYNSQRTEIKEIISKKVSKRYLSEKVLKLLNNKDWLYNEYVIKQRSGKDIGKELNIYYDTVLEYCRKYGFEIRQSNKDSVPQKEIFNYIQSIYNKEIKYNDRKLIYPYEIDILLPDKKLGIELNGIYSHSEKFKDKYYHKNKSDLMNNLGYNLLHMFDYEWNTKPDIVKYIIKSYLGLIQEINIENCKIKLLDNKYIIRDFLDKNHIKGYVQGNTNLGLYKENELLSIIIFNKLSNNNWELLRICNKINYEIDTTILFDYIVNKYNPNKIITYSDRRIENIREYKRLGFELSYVSDVDYILTDKRKIYNKHEIINLDKEYLKIWDAGRNILIWNK